VTRPETYVNSTGTNESDLGSSEPMDFSQSRAAKQMHDKILQWSQDQFRAIRNARVITERQWYMNLAFYFGKQHVAMLKPQSLGIGSGLSMRLHVPPAPYYRMRPVINRIRPTIRTELAQLTANRPNAQIVPASSEDRDMYAAMAGEQIWYNQYTDKKLKHLIRRAMWWTLICGTGFIKTYWDPMSGDMVPRINEMGIPDFDENMQPVMEPEGDIQYIVETPFHVLVPDLREEELESQPFLIHAQTKSPEQVMMKYPKALDGSDIRSGDSAAADILEDSFLNLIGTQALDKQKSILCMEVWVKPGEHPMFPEGAFYTIVGNKIVQGQMGWPYSHNKFPFAKFDHIPAGKFYSSSLVEDLIPLQKEYNRTRGQIIEAKNRMAKPQLLAPRGSVDASKITTEPGQVILYTPGVDPPQPLPLQNLPSYVIQELERILMDWSDISGQHEVTHGQVPPGVTAATAISYLQERDESKLSPTFDSLEEGVEKIAQMALSYVRDYWTTERTVKVTGPDGSFDAMAFKGSDLRNNVDIRVEGGSALPVSKAAKQAFIMDLMNMGFLEPQKGLEVMDMGGINKIYEQIQIDQRQAQRENLKMSKVSEEMLEQYNQQNMQMIQDTTEIDEETGEPAFDEETGEAVGWTAFGGQEPPLIVPVNTWDNHKKHIEVHNNFRKSQTFENLPEHVKMLFEAHVMEHIMALGIESETMHPRKAVGLGPEDPEEEGEEEAHIPIKDEIGSPVGPELGEEEEHPGPDAIPEMEGGM
jgi:hypothetical protein